jgi:hypothetical protein
LRLGITIMEALGSRRRRTCDSCHQVCESGEVEAEGFIRSGRALASVHITRAIRHERHIPIAERVA